MNKIAALLAVTLISTATHSLAAMNAANTVNSAAIVDGSIATADIANKAVTAAKIADATITATQLAAGAVTDAKITGPISVGKLPVGATATTVAAGNHTHVIGTAQIVDGAVSASKLAAGAVGTTAIANGAVTDVKITDISASKITGAIGVDKVAGYSGVKVVHTGPADGVNTFNSIAAALAATAEGSLIKIMPGTYTEDLDLTKSVTFEGCGNNLTIINGKAWGNVNGAARPAKFKDLKITGSVWSYAGVELVNASTGPVFTAFGSIKAVDSLINGTFASMTSIDAHNVTIYNGCVNFTGMSPWFTNNILDSVTISLPSDGSCQSAVSAFNTSSPNNLPGNQILINNVRISGQPAAQGLNLGQGINIKVTNSDLRGNDYGVYIGQGTSNVEIQGGKVSGGIEAIGGYGIAGFSDTISVANAQVTGPIAPNTLGTTKLVNCYDANYIAIANQ
jgi:hypothetical protein